MNILVCDSDAVSSTKIVKYITTNFSCKVFECTKINFIKQTIINDTIDLLIISTNINNDKGISLIKKLHNNKSNLKIIIINEGNAKDNSFISGVKISGYCEKPIQLNVLGYFINNVINELGMNKNKIEISYNRHRYQLNVKDIVYIQSDRRVCEIITKEKVYKSYIKLNELESKLPDYFVRGHHSYLINPEYVAELNGKSLILNTGDYIPISESKIKKVKEQFIKYRGES